MALWGRLLGRSSRSQQYDQGIRWFDQGQYEQAIAAFEEVLAEKQGTGQLLERLACFYLAESHFALALSQIAFSTPTNQAGSHAIEHLEAAIVLSPDYADLHYNLGCAYLSEGHIEEALPSLDRALQINPHYARAVLQKGVALYALGHHEEGLDCTEQALDLNADFRHTLLPDVRAAHEAGDEEMALRLMRLVGATDADASSFHARLALDLYRRGLYNEAVTEYRQAIALTPHFADVQNQLGVALFAAGRDDEAAVEFARALEINPRYGEAQFNYGLVLRRLSRTNEARQAFRSVLELDPDHHAAHEALLALDKP